MVQVRAQGTSSEIPLFVGIGSESDVARYLSDARVDRVSKIDLFPFTVGYTQQTGHAPAASPTSQVSCAASTSGIGQQDLTWRPESGRWAMVVMNADGSPNVEASISLAVDAPFLTPLGWTLIGAGAILILLGGTIVVLGATAGRRPETPIPPGPVAPVPAMTEP